MRYHVIVDALFVRKRQVTYRAYERLILGCPRIAFVFFEKDLNDMLLTLRAFLGLKVSEVVSLVRLRVVPLMFMFLIILLLMLII